MTSCQSCSSMHNIRILGAPVCQPCHLLTFSQDSRPFQTILKFLQFFWQQFSPTFGLTNDWEVSFEPKHDNILPIMYIQVCWKSTRDLVARASKKYAFLPKLVVLNAIIANNLHVSNSTTTTGTCSII